MVLSVRCRQGQAFGTARTPHPVPRSWTSVPVLLLPTQLPATVHPGKAAHGGSRTWVSAAHTGHLDWVLASWLQLGSAMAVVGHLWSEPPDERSCVCVCVCTFKNNENKK